MKIADNIGDNEDSVEVVHLFFIYLKDEAFNISKIKPFFAISSNVLYVTYICYVPKHWKR